MVVFKLACIFCNEFVWLVLYWVIFIQSFILQIIICMPGFVTGPRCTFTNDTKNPVLLVGEEKQEPWKALLSSHLITIFISFLCIFPEFLHENKYRCKYISFSPLLRLIKCSSGPPLPAGDMVQDPQRVPETTDGTDLTYTLFFLTHTYLW